MDRNSPRWHTVTASRFPHEQEALDWLRERLPDHDRYAAWANFEFITKSGAIYECDLLLLTPKAFALVELKAWGGRISGDQGTWLWEPGDGRSRAEDNPRVLTNRKAKELASLLARQPALKNVRLPYLDAAVFLSDPHVEVRLRSEARAGVFVRDGRHDPSARPGTNPPAELPGIVAGLTEAAPGVPANRIGADVVTAVTKAMQQLGIRKSRAQRQVGDWVLDELLDVGPGYQDFAAHHASRPASRRRARVYHLEPRAPEAVRALKVRTVMHVAAAS